MPSNLHGTDKVLATDEPMSDYHLLSIIIPTYNEQATVGEVIRRVLAVDLPIRKEIIVVDDGSTDRTPEVLRGLEVGDVKIHYSPVNSGKGAAVRRGLTLATGDLILIQDADLELDPEEYCQLIRPILEGQTAVVYGSRFLKPNDQIPLVRRTANWILTMTTNLLFGTRLTDMETAYKVFRADVVKRLVLRSNRFEIEPEITARLVLAGVTITEVPVSYRPRTKDEGKKIRWMDGMKSLYTLLRCRLDG